MQEGQAPSSRTPPAARRLASEADNPFGRDKPGLRATPVGCLDDARGGRPPLPELPPRRDVWLRRKTTHSAGINPAYAPLRLLPRRSKRGQATSPRTARAATPQ